MISYNLRHIEVVSERKDIQNFYDTVTIEALFIDTLNSFISNHIRLLPLIVKKQISIVKPKSILDV